MVKRLDGWRKNNTPVTTLLISQNSNTFSKLLATIYERYMTPNGNWTLDFSTIKKEKDSEWLDDRW